MHKSPSADRADENDSRTTPAADLEAVFSQNWERVCNILFRLTGDRAEAEDLAVETFVRLWQRPPANLQTVGGWLYRVAVNLGYNALRAARRRQNYELSAGEGALDINTPETPAGMVEQAEERRRVRSILAQMPDRQAQMLILRSSGLSYKEIAAALQISPTSVGTLLTRAEQEFEKRYSTGG